MNKKENRFKAASVTVECTLVLPLFLFFTIQLFSAFEMLSTYVRMQTVLEEVTVEAATVLGITEEDVSEEMSFLLSETLIREEITRKAGIEWLSKSPIIGGAAGLHLFRCNLGMDHKSVSLILTYRVKPWFAFGNVGRMTLVNSCKANIWRGYEADSGEQDEEKVYVTATGSAYHLYPDCRYLIADSRTVSGKDLGKARNNNGEKYYACELCSKGDTVQEDALYSITSWGSRYHSDPACKALIKNVKAISVSEIGTRHLCSKCAGRSGE